MEMTEFQNVRKLRGWSRRVEQGGDLGWGPAGWTEGGDGRCDVTGAVGGV